MLGFAPNTFYVMAFAKIDSSRSSNWEDKQLVDDVQKGFRRHPGAKRQLAKIHGKLADQRRRKAVLAVMLDLDIKNAFNAVNNRAIFAVLEASRRKI